jgi:predicted DsbA family dithiol-disulfide isomerase
MPFQPSGLLSNSRLAIEASEFARDAGRHHDFHRAVLAAYFGQGRDIGDLAVLQDVATKVGLDAAALAEALASGRYAGARLAVEQEANRLNIHAVPTFMFGDQTRVVGAQTLDYFGNVLRGMSADPSGERE